MISFRCVKNFCKENIDLIENYEQALNDSTQTWECHHRLETELNVSVQYLKDNDLYYNRPASELIFLTKSEHSRIHSIGRTYSDETINKLSEVHKGKHLSEETKHKLSIAHKGKKLSEEHVNKMVSSIKEYYKDHDGFWKNKKLTEETKQKMSDSHKGKCPPNLKDLLERQKLYGSPVKGKHRVYDENGKYHYE